MQTAKFEPLMATEPNGILVGESVPGWGKSSGFNLFHLDLDCRELFHGDDFCVLEDVEADKSLWEILVKKYEARWLVTLDEF